MRFRAPDLVLLLLTSSMVLPSTLSAASGIHRFENGEARPAEVGLDPRVGDPVFAFLLGVVDDDLWGWVDQAYLDSLSMAHEGSALPVELVERMERNPREQGVDAEVRLLFTEKIKTPIPFSILGYNPGSIRADRELLMGHWTLPDQTVTLPGEEEGSEVEMELRGAELFVFEVGSMRMDIDYLLDKFMGSRLDDVDLSGFLIFPDEDRRIGLGFGYNGSGNGRTGAFDFYANESLFPAPDRYLALGRLARGLGETLREAPGAPRYLSTPAPEGALPR